jgi:hypothetical protein
MRRTYSTAIGLLLFVAPMASAHGLYERFLNDPRQMAVMVIGCTDAQGQQPVGFGSGSFLAVPLTTNPVPNVVCLITAKHNLFEVTNGKPFGKPFNSLLLKIPMPAKSAARYLKIPLKHDEPKNYWVSPTGLDLAVIPVAKDQMRGTDVRNFQEKQIVTPETAKIVDPCMIAVSMCFQPEYLDAIDFSATGMFPAVRLGHLSRIGFAEMANGVSVVRPHVIDLHSSPGNSGACVMLVVPQTNSDVSVTQFMFLGVVEGFREEQGSYIPYDAPVTNKVRITNLHLVSAKTGATNSVALAVKTVANPNLTNVIPVHELVGLRNSSDFAKVLQVADLLIRANLYEVRTELVPPPPRGDQAPSPPQIEVPPGTKTNGK